MIEKDDDEHIDISARPLCDMRDEWEPEPTLPRVTTDFSADARRNLVSQISREAQTGAFSDEVVQFIFAADAAQRAKGSMLTKSEMFQVVLSLGYVSPTKCAECRLRSRPGTDQ